MPTYCFACAHHGRFDAVLRIDAVADRCPCPTCGAPSGRRFTPPGLNLGDARARRVIEATEATSEAPPVVRSLPPGPRRRQRVTRNPLAARLPRD